MKKLVILYVLIAGAHTRAFGQGPSLTLIPVSTTSNSMSMNLSFTASGTVAIAGLQWTIPYNPTLISGISAVAGPSLTAANKTLSCADTGGAYTCVAVGLNSLSLGTGVVATINVTTLSSTAVSINLNNANGVSPNGTLVALALSGGTAPTADSVTPNVGSGASGTFTFRYSSANGSGNLAYLHALFNGTLNGSSACWVYYSAAVNGLFLLNDTQSASTGPLQPGSNGTLQNSQCTLNGAGSSVTGAANTVAMTLALTFKPSFTGTQTAFGSAFDNASLTSGWQALGTWQSSVPAVTPPTADSVTPNAGMGTSGSFTFRYSSVNGNGYLKYAHALFNATLNGSSACWVYYSAAVNSLYLMNDAQSASTGPLTPGSNATLQNSQCTLNGVGSSVAGAGNTLAMTLALTFKPAFNGSQKAYGSTFDSAGLTSGWQALGTWKSAVVVATAPTADSVTPNGGMGTSGSFTFRYSSVNGNGYLPYVHALFNGTLNGNGACWVYYSAAVNGLYLLNDTQSGSTGPIAPGSIGTLQNSQCTLNGAGSSVTGAGNTLAMTLAMTFKPSFGGVQTAFASAFDSANLTSGWQALGTWKSAVLVATPPTADSVTPNAGMGTSGSFTFRYSSVNGAGNLAYLHALLNGTLTGNGACWVYYAAAGNGLYLLNDTQSASTGPLHPGSSGTLQNSQCTLNGAGSSVTGAGNTLALTLALTFKPAFSGAQTAFGSAFDSGNLTSGWQALGNWKSTAAAAPPPTADLVTPNAGTGASASFAFRYSSANGSAYLQYVHALFNGTLNGNGACWVYYSAAVNGLYLLNDTQTGSTGPLTPGSNGTLQNSQCKLSGAGSSVVGSGNTLTMTLGLTFKPSFIGTQTAFGSAFDNANLSSGWQTLGTWKTY